MSRLPLVLLAFLAAPAAAQVPPAAVQTSDEALARDAVEYGRLHRLDAAEALRRLRAEAASGDALDEIRAAYANRLVGIAVVQGADFHISVLLTGTSPVADRIVGTGETAVPVRFRIGAPATGIQLAAAIARHRDGIDALVGHSGIGVDQRTGAVVVVTGRGGLRDRPAEAVTADLAALMRVPVHIRLLDATATQESGIAGGRRVEGNEPGDGRRYFCTTGFVVTDGVRSGIVTAAHCPNRLSYRDAAGAEVALEFAGEWGAKFQDVQVHVGPSGQAPVFRAAEADRPQIARRLRDRTRAGETVCHRGEASGYSCSVVDLTDFAPPGALCAGRCTPNWVTVAGPTCRGGDSGGPVFVGTTAFGIVKGSNYAADGSCNFFFYMSTDYLPPGWSLLLADEPAAASPD